MAWTSVTYSCGCTGSEQMYGKGSERTKRVEWIERSKLCPDCYRKQLEESREQERKEASEKAEKFSLPSLEGTEKQIRWAEVIRAGIIEKNLVILGNIKDEKFLAFAKERVKRLMNETKAHVWIEKRETFACTEERVLLLYKKECDKENGLAILNG